MRPARPGRRDRAGRRRRRAARRVLPVRRLPAGGGSPGDLAEITTAGRTCRTRAASWWPARWSTRRWRAATSAGWTCAPVPAARRACWRRSPPARRAPDRGRGRRAPRAAGRQRRARPAREVVCIDGREGRRGSDLPEGGFDRVLVDAPCTGLGSLRRRPESRWRRQPSDLPPLTKLQRELIAAALRAVRPGGAGGVRDLLAASGGDAGQRHRGGAPLRPGGRVLDARPSLPAGMPGLGDGPDACSCGRTGTAPTRCSWPCCGATPEPTTDVVTHHPRSSRR